jgi:uncharacterized protein with ParB-like and HNH nuclease domain
MDDPFKPLSLSVKELFGNTDSFYKIPQYQRPYKWENEQVDKLWDDIYEAYDNKEDNYFLGSIITAKPRDDERSAYVDVVDGQQRLTTLMILFCVVRDVYPRINEKISDDDPRAVDIDTIKTSIAQNEKSQRLKLHTHSQHQSDFEMLISKGNTSILSRPNKQQLRSDEEPKYKFMNTAVILREKLVGLGEMKSAALLDYLFNQVKIIRIDCRNREFAIKLFQVLNDRGMDLTAADLIKSFLLERLYKQHKDDQDSSKLKEAQFIADWRAMEQSIKSCDISLNDLFIIYEYYLLGQNPKKSLYDELQNAFSEKDPNIVISDIKQFAERYANDIHDATNKVLFSLWYLRWNMYWKSICLTALHTNYPDFDRLIKSLSRYYYLNWIAGKTLSQIKQTSFNLIKWIKEKKVIGAIEQELHKKLAEDGVIDLAKRNLSSEQLATEPWIKPLLLRIEYNQTDDSKLFFINLDSHLHLEHILPQKHHKHPEWKHITKELSASWLNSAGNLTLLCGAKNIEASNNPFSIKMEIYKGKGKYENKDTKITAFLMTQKVLDDYRTKTYAQMWTHEAMIDRWKWFFKEAGEILEIDVSDLIDKHHPEAV